MLKDLSKKDKAMLMRMLQTADIRLEEIGYPNVTTGIVPDDQIDDLGVSTTEDTTALAKIGDEEKLLIINPTEVEELFTSIMHQIGMLATTTGGIEEVDDSGRGVLNGAIWALKELKDAVGYTNTMLMGAYANYGMNIVGACDNEATTNAYAEEYDRLVQEQVFDVETEKKEMLGKLFEKLGCDMPDDLLH